MPIAKILIIIWMALSAVSRASRFFSTDTKKEKRFSEMPKDSARSAADDSFTFLFLGLEFLRPKSLVTDLEVPPSLVRKIIR
jgi:hypothetical protein